MTYDNTREIALTRGMTALVDADDYEWVVSRKWHFHATGYAIRYLPVAEGGIGTKFGGVRQRMHRAIWELQNGPIGKGLEIDHINGNRLDNRKTNLRACTRAQNAKNRPVYKNSKSGHKGVYWYPYSDKWQVTIRNNGRLIHVGYFSELDDAIKARKAAEEKYQGAFSRV